MSNVVRENIDNLNAVLTVSIPKESYEKVFKSEFNKVASKAQIKGFRPGKVPKDMLLRLYGNSILTDIVEKEIQKKLDEYLNAEKINILGKPLVAPKQNFSLNAKDLIDYEIKFEIGLMPEFELKGVDKDTVMKNYQVIVTDEMKAEELMYARRKKPNIDNNVVDDIQENDLLKLTLIELDGDAPKENGIVAEDVLVLVRLLGEAAQAQFLKAKKDDTLKINIRTLENEGTSDKQIRKNFLKLEDDDDRPFNDEFQATIHGISRYAPAHLDQTFFDATFGKDQVFSEEEALEKCAEAIKNAHKEVTENILYRRIQDMLVEKNHMDLPDAFLKRWLKSMDPKNTDAIIEAGYEKFARSMRWDIITDKLIQQFPTQVTEDEILDVIVQRLSKDKKLSHFDSDILNIFAKSMLENEKYAKEADQIGAEVFTQKLLRSVANNITLDVEELSIDDFDKKMRETVDELKKADNPSLAIAPANELVEEVEIVQEG